MLLLTATLKQSLPKVSLIFNNPPTDMDGSVITTMAAGFSLSFSLIMLYLFLLNISLNSFDNLSSPMIHTLLNVDPILNSSTCAYVCSQLYSLKGSDNSNSPITSSINKSLITCLICNLPISFPLHKCHPDPNPRCFRTYLRVISNSSPSGWTLGSLLAAAIFNRTVSPAAIS